MFAGLPSHYDRLATLLSLGQDPRWRRFMVSRVRVPAGGRVLDVATGTAAVAVALAARTGASVVGLDQSEPMLRTGVARVKAAGLASRVRCPWLRAGLRVVSYRLENMGFASPSGRMRWRVTCDPFSRRN